MELCQSILVVEDNNDVRESLVDALANEGYRVKSAKDGKEGLEKLANMPGPTLIFLDLMMPTMSGWEFLDAQKGDESMASHRVVTISAVKASQSLQDTTPLETAGTIAKPIQLDRLWAEAFKHCGPPENHRNLAIAQTLAHT